MLPLSGCLGLFGGDDGAQEQANSTSIDSSVDNETARQLEERSAGQFKNYTIPGQEDLEHTTLWLNGTLVSGEAAAAYEDRNDRSGTNYNTEIVTKDISEQLPDGQPAELKIKLWYFPTAGQSGDLDIYVNVPGTETEFDPGGCDAFSWKVCTQEQVVNTVGLDGEAAEVGVQKTNGRAVEDVPYKLKVEATYPSDVIGPSVPYAFDVPEDATGLVVESEKAGGGEHVKANVLVIGPDDELVQQFSYNDIAIPSESKLVPVSDAGEHVVYAPEMQGGFLGVEADVPVPDDKRQAQPLEKQTETVIDGQAGPGSAGTGETCVPDVISQGCAQNTTWNAGGSSAFTSEGTFPVEITTFINEGGETPVGNMNLDAEIRVKSPDGLVHRSKKIVQWEDERGTIGMSRDEVNTVAHWDNLAKGEYTVEYVIDGTASVGHTLTTYQR
jgi:hypothetical protein